MRVNESLLVQGPLVRLVPYRREHVPQYHTWMQDPALLEQTCSEPLSLEEEFANQKSWHEDECKLTFIVCAVAPGLPVDDLTLGMVGDVNAFFTPWDAESDQPAEEAGAAEAPLLAEVEIMVADASQRRRGLGRQALLLFLQYVAELPRVSGLCAKIGEDNAPSLRLFDALGFVEHKRMAVFQQVELRLPLSADARARLREAWAALGAQELPLEADLAAGSEPEAAAAAPTDDAAAPTDAAAASAEPSQRRLSLSDFELGKVLGRGHHHLLLHHHHLLLHLHLHLLRHHHLHQVLGRGSFGTVAVATRRATGEVFAMKSLSKRMLIAVRQTNSAMLEREILRRPSHPFVCRSAASDPE